MKLKKSVSILLLVVLFNICISPCVFAKSKKVISGSVQDYRFDYVNLNFWDKFEDDILKNYIIKAIESNHDLKTATLKTEEYKNFARMSLGRELPQISFGFNAMRVRTPEMSIAGMNTDSETMNMFSVPLIASYELDLFLKNRDKTRSADKVYLASKYAEKAAYISLITSVATVYFNIVQFDRLIELQTKLVDSRKIIFDLTNERYKVGLTPKSDVNTAEQSYLNAGIKLSDMLKQRSVLLNQLAILTGQSPEGSEGLVRTSFDELKFNAKMPESIPSEVIFNRPDVLQMQAELERAKIDIRVARKEMLPSIPIIGNIGFSSNQFGSIFNWGNMLAMVAGGVMQSVYTGGVKTANLKIKKNQYEQLFNKYQKTDLTAMQEVNDSMCAVKFDSQNNVDTEKMYNLELKNYKWAENKYKTGLISYLVQTQYKERLLVAQQAKTLSQTQEFVSYLTLYKAVGGKI